MKILAIFAMLGMLVTARVAAHDDVGPTRVQTAALTATGEASAGDATARFALPDALRVEGAEGAEGAAGIGVLGQCEELRNICTAACLEFIGNARGACLRACTRDYNDCLGG